jgi:hypothetical protein
MSIFKGPVEAFNYLLAEAQNGRPYELDEVFDAESGEDPTAEIGTGWDMESDLWLHHPHTGPVLGDAALRVVSLAPGFRQPEPTQGRLFLRSRLRWPDPIREGESRFSVARYWLTRAAVQAVVDGQMPNDPDYKVEWVQGWPPEEQAVSVLSGDTVPHIKIVSQAREERPGLLVMLSGTNNGTFRPRGLEVMASYAMGRI